MWLVVTTLSHLPLHYGVVVVALAQIFVILDGILLNQ